METIMSEAKRLLKQVPDKNMITSVLTDGTGKGCPEGWLIGLKEGLNAPAISSGHEHGADFKQKVNGVIQAHTFGEYYISAVANQKKGKYQQSTPKKRVMALLSDCIKAGL